MIYFAQRTTGGPIKIGTSDAVKRRMSDLGTSLKTKVVVLAIMEGGVAEEASLHRRFARLRVEGEWFNAGPELTCFIEQNGKTWDGIDHVAKTGDPDDLLSIRNAAILLGVNRMWLQGYIDGSGIHQVCMGTAHGIRRRDLNRVSVPQRKEA